MFQENFVDCSQVMHRGIGDLYGLTAGINVKHVDFPIIVSPAIYALDIVVPCNRFTLVSESEEEAA
jgi:hypothetical protein